MGKEVTEYYLKEGQKYLKSVGIEVPYELTYLEGDLMESYIRDLQIVQKFARLNRETILDSLAKGMKWKVLDVWSSVHNYIDISGNERISPVHNGLPIPRTRSRRYIRCFRQS